jgi:uncharacterized membrane protein YheB (UPF0754 family)
MIDYVLIAKCVAIPLISAFIGWVTNVVAIKMLFYPRKPFMCMQGLIPKKKEELAERIADIVSTELVNYENITKKMNGAGGRNKISETITNFINIPILGDFVGEVVNEYLKEMGNDSQISQKTDMFIRNMVKEKIQNFDLDKLEDMVYKVANNEFKTIEILGFYLGGLIGIVQVLIMLMI